MRPKWPRAAASWTKRSGRRARRARDSTRTRTTNHGGGFQENEGVLPVARGGGGDRWGGLVVRLAAACPGARGERAPGGRGGGRDSGGQPVVGAGPARKTRLIGHLGAGLLRGRHGGGCRCRPRAASHEV